MPLKLALGAAVFAAISLAATACGSSHPQSAQGTNGQVSSSRTLLGGRVQCTATVKTPVQVGAELGITFKFHNISKLPADLQLSYGGVWAIVKSPDGTAYDTRVPLENARGPGVVGPTSVQPGATLTQHLRPDLRIRWNGPLRVTPGCGLAASRPLQVAVTSAGMPTSTTAAIDDVVAATGHLLDHCRPRTPGVSVGGRIDAPSGDMPSLQARCSIDLRREGTFNVAQVLVVTPPDLHGVQVDQTYEALTGTTAGNRNAQALAWEFVVTRAGATSVSSANYETTRRGGRMAHGWFWNSAGPGPKSGDDFQCGGSGGSTGNANGPEVSFISDCGRGR